MWGLSLALGIHVVTFLALGPPVGRSCVLGGLVSWEVLCREVMCHGRSYVGRSCVIRGLMSGFLVLGEVLCREV